jgi:hypothetical protein
MLAGADTRLEDTLGGLFVLTGCVCSRAVDYLMAKEQHDAAAAIVCHRQWLQTPTLLPIRTRCDAASVKKIYIHNF